jgi:phosphoribosylaminoimidazole (AIR) synthetase
LTSLGEALLIPTRLYCKAVLPLMKDKMIKGFAHITGKLNYFDLINPLILQYNPCTY